MFAGKIRSGFAALALHAGVAASAVAAETYEVDPVHSSVIFRAKHLGVGHVYGRFNDVSGTIVVDDAKPEACSVSIEIKAESVDTNNEGRDRHLRSPDFLNAGEFPILSFKSKEVKKKGLAKDEFELTGDFTLRGVTKAITVKATRIGSGPGMRGEHRAGFETTFAVKRSEHGVNYMPQGIGEEIWITLAVECIRK